MISLTVLNNYSLSSRGGLTAKSINESISFICVCDPNTAIIDSKLYRAKDFNSGPTSSPFNDLWTRLGTYTILRKSNKMTES